jgi:hypothetical protein
MKSFVLAIVLALAGCATQHTVTLYPRGVGEHGAGSLDRTNNHLAVTVGGKQYNGLMITRLGPPHGQASALLLGDGQMRCDFQFDAMWQTATGICVDSKNVTYDMLVK